MAPLISRHRGCKTVSKAKLQKAFSALLISQEPGALYAEPRAPRCELKRSEFRCTRGGVIELLSPQNGSAVRVIDLPRAQEGTCPNQEDATRECAVSENLGNGSGNSDESVMEPLDPQDESAPGNKQKRTLGGCLGDPYERIRSHLKVTMVVLIVLLLLVVALAVSLAAVSGRRQTEIPVLLACSDGWVGYRGICYFLSKDHRSWDQAQARCSELGASLAVLKDEEMEFVFRLSRNIDHWLGLRRRDQGLQWVDGSSFNSSVPLQGNAECVHLAENKLACAICSNSMQYICSRPQTHH